MHIGLALFFSDDTHQALDFLGTEVLLEGSRVEQLAGLVDDLVHCLEVLARWCQCAPGAPLVEDHISLQVDS